MMIRYALGLFFIALSLEMLFKIIGIHIAIIQYIVPVIFLLLGLFFILQPKKTKTHKSDKHS